MTALLRDCGPVAVAVSGGVDSMTLAAVAQLADPASTVMFHAVSPAVPQAATERVRRSAAARGWALRIIDAGEFEDARYMANPSNRCYFCKNDLYGVIASEAAGSQVLSGTNLDDLGDWRPGLQAAAAHGVRHPFVEAGLTKVAVRELARRCGLDDVAELPASPCLSSRVETGIAIDPVALRFVERAERAVLHVIPAAETVRCRIRRTGVSVELDDASYARMTDEERTTVIDVLDRMRRVHRTVEQGEIAVVPYTRGSAFLREAS